MLIAFLLVLSAVKINCEAVDQDGLRRSRQLDLGLQNIRTGDEEVPTTVRTFSTQKEIVNNGYLPPVSSSLSPDISSAQSQKTFDFKPVNSLENESDLCKPPFDQESCQSKDSSTSDSKIPKPSRDLLPPFNDLEQELLNKAPALFEQANEEVKTTVDIQTTFTTTTAKPVTKIYKSARIHNIPRFIKTTPRSRPVVSTAEATNQLRSYLPPQPEFSAAAQTNVAVVQPQSQNNHDHDHHHHHHHGENFNICDDPFHAFLCTPLKARKRITGALPSSLLGQSSYINYQKTLRNFDRETAPSNAVSNQYLPPKPSPTNLMQSSYLPPATTEKPIITTTTTTARPYSPPSVVPQSSNTDDRFYLPPLPSNSLAAGPVNPPVKQTFTTVKAPTTPVPNTISPSTIKTTPTVIQNSIFQNVSPTIPVFNSPSSQENTFYLQPSPSPLPAASFISNSQSAFPVVSSPISSTYVPLPTVTSFASLPSNSIVVPQKPKVQPTIPVIITAKPPALVENVQAFSTVSSSFPTVPPIIQTTQGPVVPVSSFASQPSNPSGSYLPPVSESLPFSKPTTTTVKPPPVNFSSQSSNADRAYLPPDPNEPAAAQISSAAVAAPQVKNPFHHGRDLCTDPFHSFLCTSGKPRKRITGQLPSGFSPESSNTNELRLKPEPSNQDEHISRPEKFLEGTSAQNVGYNYPKPFNPFPTPSTAVTSTSAPSTGYSYPKLDKIFPLPSQQDFKAVSLTTTKKPEPVYRPNEARVVTGYQYPKPDKIFPLPAGQDNNKIITTTSAPSTGYSYPRPQKPFPLPSEQKEIRQKPKPKVTSSTPSVSLPTNTFKGYQYPKPDQSLKLPEKKGYSYPKPDKRLELPTEARSKFKLPQSSNSDPLQSLGSADFIPVNKVEFKRAESSKLLMGLRRFGERMRKREREAQLYRKQMFYSIYKYKYCLRIQKSKKIRRDLRTEFEEFEEQLKLPQNDVEIVPENQQTTSNYPNHRYTDDPPETKSKVWPSERMGSKTHPENIKDQIPNSKVTGQNGRFPNEKLKISGSSMRLKGVYKQLGSKQYSLGAQNPYSKEINNLMQYDFGPEEKQLVKHAFRNRGSPFRLPLKGEETQKRQKTNFQRDQKLKHPITIYLDFYPMNPQEGKQKKVSTGLTIHSKSLTGKESIGVKKFALPPRKQNGIVMKLNLYPKSPPRPGLERPARGSLSRHKKTAERKSLGWFFKDKKEKHQRECTFMGLNPRKSHITAKWKNDKGEWIHADHVDVKYLKKEKD